MSPMGNEDREDAALLAELRELASRWIRSHRNSWPWPRPALSLHSIDADLAALTYDSAVDIGDMALVRGPATLRLLTFEGPGITVELEAVTVGRRRRLVGQLVPAQAAGSRFAILVAWRRWTPTTWAGS